MIKINRGQSEAFTGKGIINFNFKNGFTEGIDGSRITLDPLRVLAHELGHIARPPDPSDRELHLGKFMRIELLANMKTRSFKKYGQIGN